MRNLIYGFALIFCLSCNQHDTQNRISKKTTSLLDTSIAIKETGSSQNLTQPQKLNYDNWDLFWKNFTTATKKKDTATIIELTNFPFFQNSYPTYQNEFHELWVSQSFDLRNTDTTVASTDIVLQMQKPDKEELPKFDSVRYTSKNGKDFYFAKINGYYRLVEVITPG